MSHPLVWTFVVISLLLVLGGSSGVEAQIDELVVIDLANADLTFLGEEAGAWAGYSVSPAGDINNDGYDDFLVGAPYGPSRPPAGVTFEPGEAYLVLGRARHEWPASHIDLSQADASFLGATVAGPDYGMTGRQNYTAGDVNGDGYDDFLISGWKAGSGLPAQGKAYLFLGSSNVDWGLGYPVEQADASFLGENEGDFAGYYLSTAGDVNADGYDDFLITSAQNDEAGLTAGQVYLILGRPQADWGIDFGLGQADASFLGEAEDDRAGRSAAGVGDVNDDGYDDFLIGAVFNDEGGTDAGQSYLILGREEADWGRDYSLAGADASFIGEAAGDESGRRVAGAGDVNGDKYNDFLIGASRNSEGGFEAGKAYLILGRETADWGSDYPLSLADAAFIGENDQDQAGRRVSSAGDVNSDGYDDFLIGAHHNDRGDQGAGTAYLVFGRQAADWGRHFPLQNADVAYVGEGIGDRAGYDVAPAGDVDGDWADDLLIGAWHGSENGEMAGQAYLVYGSLWRCSVPLVLKSYP